MGVTLDGVLYIAETYGTDDYLAYHRIQAADGTFLETRDEAEGRQVISRPKLPPDALKTAPVQHSTLLNFTGPRYRGQRETDRIGDVVQQLTMQEKMALVERLQLGIMPPMLLGLAESVVLSEAVLSTGQFVVCRRLRFAYLLSETHYDDDGSPYDYDSKSLHTAHTYTPDDDAPSITQALDGLPGATLHQPMDCLTVGNHLYIADSGSTADHEGDVNSAIHVWELQG